MKNKYFNWLVVALVFMMGASIGTAISERSCDRDAFFPTLNIKGKAVSMGMFYDVDSAIRCGRILGNCSGAEQLMITGESLDSTIVYELKTGQGR